MRFYHSTASAFRVTLWCVFRLFLFETSDDVSHGKGLGSFGFTADEASHGQTAKLRNECLRDTIGRRCSANISPILTSCVGVGHRQWTPSDNWTNLFTNWMVNLSVRPIVEFDCYILLVMTSSVASWRPSELSKVIQANPLSKERNRWCQRRLPSVQSQSSPDWVENPRPGPLRLARYAPHFSQSPYLFSLVASICQRHPTWVLEKQKSPQISQNDRPFWTFFRPLLGVSYARYALLFGHFFVSRCVPRSPRRKRISVKIQMAMWPVSMKILCSGSMPLTSFATQLSTWHTVTYCDSYFNGLV